MVRVLTQVFGVVSAFIERDGKFLLVKESERKRADAGKWNHPGGWLEVGEGPIEGVEREVEEETGFKFTPTNILGIYSLVRKDLLRAGQDIAHPIKVVFLGKISDEKIRELEEDVIEIKWFTPEEIEKMNTDTLRDLDIKQMVEDYFSGKRYPLDLLTHTVQE